MNRYNRKYIANRTLPLFVSPAHTVKYNNKPDEIDVFIKALEVDKHMTMYVSGDTNRDRSIDYGFIGLGQGGGRLAASFVKYGYKVLAINTSRQDLDGLKLDDEYKLAIADDGAGKDTTKAKAAVKKMTSVIREKILEVFYDKDTNKPLVGRFILCAGGGGGTGSGSVSGLLDVLEYLGMPGKIGSMITLPMSTEDSKSKINTIRLLNEVIPLSNDGRLAPIIIVDNEKIKERYPGISMSQFWDKANNEVAKIFHLMNLLTFKGSEYHSLDPADYTKIMNTNRFTVFGRSVISEKDLSKERLKQSIDMQVSQRKSLLAGGFDVFQAQNVGCIIIAKPETLQKIPMETLEAGFDHIRQHIKSGRIFRGVYALEKTQTTGLELLTMWSGVNTPAERLIQMREEAESEKRVFQKKEEATSVEDILGDLDDIEG